MKNLCLKIFAVMALSLSSVGYVYADCDLRGYAVRVSTFPSGTHMYFRPSHLSPYYYRGVTNDPEVAAAMFQALKGKTKMLIRSDADSCPAVGGAGEKFIGVITIVGLGY